MRIQCEPQRTTVEFETQRLDIEKTSVDLSRERDSELSQIRSKLEAEIKSTVKRPRRPFEANSETAVRLSTLDQHASFSRELEEQLSEKNDEIATIKNEKNTKN